MRRAPDFTLPDQFGKTHSLAQYARKWVVLFFYPKDGTPICTAEACNFRDTSHELQKADIIVLGVSRDTAESHLDFANKHNLQFTLLSDTTGDTINAYGCDTTISLFGKRIQSVKRHTFLINPQGEIVKEYTTINPLNQAQTIMQEKKRLMTA